MMIMIVMMIWLEVMMMIISIMQVYSMHLFLCDDDAD